MDEGQVLHRRAPAPGGVCRLTARRNTVERMFWGKDLNDEDNSENLCIGDDRFSFGIIARGRIRQSTGTDKRGLGCEREHHRRHAFGAGPADGASLEPTGQQAGGRGHRSALGIQRD